jgi:hypothetical protein
MRDHETTDHGTTTEDGRRRTEDGRQRTEDGGRWTEDGRRWTEGGGRWTEDGRWELGAGSGEQESKAETRLRGATARQGLKGDRGPGGKHNAEMGAARPRDHETTGPRTTS